MLLLATTGQLADARNGFAATLVILVGVVLATAPLWRRLLDSRAEERAARIRSEERAAVAAHLHDSVLQTLALIQRHADDPQRGRPAGPQPGARAAQPGCTTRQVVHRAAPGPAWSAGMVAEVEADHALTVDPVVVGDAAGRRRAGRARRGHPGGLVNAAKHSGATAADLYTEVTAERGVGLRPRPRGRVRPGGRARRTGAGCATRSTGRLRPARRHGRRALGAGGGDRGGAGAAEESA